MREKSKNLSVALVAICSLGLVGTASYAAQIARGVWAVNVEIEHTDQSPVKIKSNKALSDLNDQLRRLGQVPEASASEGQSKFNYACEECVSQRDGLGWIDTEQLFSTANWTCQQTNRFEGNDSVRIDFVCPEDGAKGTFEVRFPTDSTATGTLVRTDMSGRIRYETGRFTARSTRRTQQCTR